MKPNGELSVEERIRAAVALAKKESPGKLPSISELCRMAGVNRGNAYLRYRYLFDEFCRTQKVRRVNEAPSNSGSKRQESIELKNRALLYLCLELLAEVKGLRAEVDSHRPVTAKAKAKARRSP